MALSDQERAILDFERDWALEVGNKDAAIRSRLGMSPSIFYKVRRSLLDSPDALEYDPLVVRRLRRDIDSRRRARFEGRTAGHPR
jgi:hypothetical protein